MLNWAPPFFAPTLNLQQEPREENAAYIANWLEVLKNDSGAIFSAAAHAQRAADYLNRVVCPRASGRIISFAFFPQL